MKTMATLSLFAAFACFVYGAWCIHPVFGLFMLGGLLLAWAHACVDTVQERDAKAKKANDPTGR